MTTTLHSTNLARDLAPLIGAQLLPDHEGRGWGEADYARMGRADLPGWIVVVRRENGRYYIGGYLPQCSRRSTWGGHGITVSAEKGITQIAAEASLAIPARPCWSAVRACAVSIAPTPERGTEP